MNDFQHASTFFLIFAVVLLLYALLIVKTGDKRYLPLRAQHSVRTKEDVRRAGRATVKVALVIAALALIGIIASQLR